MLRIVTSGVHFPTGERSHENHKSATVVEIEKCIALDNSPMIILTHLSISSMDATSFSFPILSAKQNILSNLWFPMSSAQTPLAQEPRSHLPQRMWGRVHPDLLNGREWDLLSASALCALNFGITSKTREKKPKTGWKQRRTGGQVESSYIPMFTQKIKLSVLLKKKGNEIIKPEVSVRRTLGYKAISILQCIHIPTAIFSRSKVDCTVTYIP